MFFAHFAKDFLEDALHKHATTAFKIMMIAHGMSHVKSRRLTTMQHQLAPYKMDTWMISLANHQYTPCDICAYRVDNARHHQRRIRPYISHTCNRTHIINHNLHIIYWCHEDYQVSAESCGLQQLLHQNRNTDICVKLTSYSAVVNAKILFVILMKN